MAEVNLVSSFAMGLVLLGLIVAVTRMRQWHRAPVPAGGRPSFEDAADNPAAWGLVFVLVTMLIAVGAIAYVGGTIPGVGAGIAGPLLFGGLGLVFVLFLGGGIYAATMNRGLSSSQAAAVSALLLGTLVLVAIALHLVIG